MTRPSSEPPSWRRRLPSRPPICVVPSNTRRTWSECSRRARSARPSSAPEGGENDAGPTGDQRREARGRCRAAAVAGPFDPGRVEADRHPHRLRHHALRGLHRPHGWPGREVVHDFRRPGSREGDHDGGRSGAERTTPPAPGRLHGRARPAVRLLYARDADDELRVPQEAPGPDRNGHPLGDLRQPLPLHRLRQHRQGRPVRGGQAPRGRRMMALRTSPEVGGMGHSIKRKEDPRFIRGKGTYVDDVQLPGMLYLDIVRSPFAHARIKKIDTAKALAVPGVLAVITGQDLAKYNLHWMPTLMSDTQMVLPVEKVMYQAQEVAAVLATTRYAAADGMAAVEVEYDPLPVVVDPHKALEPGAPVLRTDKKDKKDNHIWHWEWGDGPATDRALEAAEVTVKEDIYIPRIHVASIETCGCIAHFDKVEGKLTVWMTTQAPHAIRTVFALVAGHVGLAEHKIRIVSPDIGGGFGGKVPVYPGYVIAVAASVLTGKPVKWIEDRMENLQADSFARDYHITAELAAKKDGRLTALRIKTIADHGYTDAAANPSKFPAGLFHVCTGSYDLKAAHVEVDGAYTNKPPGGIAYRCSFRVTEAVHTIERMADVMAHQLKMDPADFRMKNFVKPEQFPYKSALGWEYDSGNYAGALQLAMDKAGYAELRQEQAEKRSRGELMGIGISSFTEIVGAGPSKHFDILGIKMFDSAEIRVHPTGKVMARFGTKSQGQGH